MDSRSTHRRGAVLVETLVAMALLVVTMGFLVQFVTRSTTRSAMARARAKGALLAQEKMEEILSAPSPQQWAARAKGTYAVEGEAQRHVFPSEQLSDFRWDWEVVRSESHPDMHEVAIRVFWQFPGREEFGQQYELRTLVPQPSARETGEGVTP